MTVGEAKGKAKSDGWCELTFGVYLITGKQVLNDTMVYRDTLCTDYIAKGYTVEDIIPDDLYIQTDGYFSSADDDDIEKILNNN